MELWITISDQVHRWTSLSTTASQLTVTHTVHCVFLELLRVSSFRHTTEVRTVRMHAHCYNNKPRAASHYLAIKYTCMCMTLTWLSGTLSSKRIK